jgi:flagellar assembly factor FliW
MMTRHRPTLISFNLQILHMLVFGCHPFLFKSDLALSLPEQIIRLLENTLKGNMQVRIILSHVQHPSGYNR